MLKVIWCDLLGLDRVEVMCRDRALAKMFERGRVEKVFVEFWLVVFFFKQKRAYEVRISDWSSDGCSSDLSLRRTGSMPSIQKSPRPACEASRGVIGRARRWPSRSTSTITSPPCPPRSWIIGPMSSKYPTGWPSMAVMRSFSARTLQAGVSGRTFPPTGGRTAWRGGGQREHAGAGLGGAPGGDRQGRALACAFDFHNPLAALSAEVLDQRADVVEIPDRLAVDGGEAVVLGQHAPGRGVGPDLAHHRRQQRLARGQADAGQHAALVQALGQGGELDRKSTRLNSSHYCASRMPSSA